MELVDSHCHLDFPDFQEDLDGVVARAHNAGINWMLTICTRMTKLEQIIHLTESFDNVFCTAGIHPNNVADEPEVSTEALIKASEHPKVVGFGETGFDFFYDTKYESLQERSFLAHIEAARKTRLPLVVHTRNADQKTIDTLRSEYAKGAFPALIHCFSSSRQLANAALELGFYISISGIITFKKSDDLREIVRTIPKERILLETDAPYLAPVPMRGKRNEPAFTAHTAEKVATLKEIELAHLASVTTNNFFSLFKKAAPNG